MLTIKSLKSGKNAVYVENNPKGRTLVSLVLTANTRVGDSIRIKPLRSGKIAMYLNNDHCGRELVSTLLGASVTPQVPYTLDLEEDGDFDFEDDIDFDEEDFDDLEFEDEVGEEKHWVKCCTKCGQWKGLASFYRQKDGLHERRGDCIVCYKQARSSKASIVPEISLSNVVTIFTEKNGNVYATNNGEKLLECNIGTFDENYQYVKRFCERNLPGHKIKNDTSTFDALCEGLPY